MQSAVAETAQPLPHQPNGTKLPAGAPPGVGENSQPPDGTEAPAFGELEGNWVQVAGDWGTDALYPVPTVVTFHPHPQEFFTRQPKPKLTAREEKVDLLRAIGVEQLVLLPFDEKIAQLSPQEFVEQILVRHLRAVHVSVGANFRFGIRRSGTADDLRAIAANYGVRVTVVPLESCQGERISSSAIRSALLGGDVTKANRLLGRSWSLTGTVTVGQQIGRTLGFPTANLQLPAEKFLPQYGVYAVRVGCPSQAGDRLPKAGVMNIGCRPTVAGTHPTVEVHLFDWAGDLYGQQLTVSLEQFLRPEQKFPSLEALKAQIAADCLAARAILEAGL